MSVTYCQADKTGSAMLLAAGHDMLITGDGLVTASVVNGRQGPQVGPFTADPDQALGSLDQIDGVEAAWLLPGHGPAWNQGVATAVDAARRTGVTHLARP